VSQLDAIALSNAVKRRLVDFALNSHFVRDPQLTRACRELWSGAPETGGLLSDLWIEGAFPAEAAPESLDELVKQKLFHRGLSDHLNKRGVMPKDRPLYLHQRDAVIKAQATYPDNAKPALVVTAGTGTGKTESFLLPILNDLFMAPATKETGVRCIILYPMNALVNDQVDRLYDWLQGQRKVTLFHFTSETPEDKAQANKDGVSMWDICRMRTRKEARGLETHDGQAIDLSNSSRGPVPDIIVTNYSMLEYMLCRPQDAVFFGKALRAIVLDEVHLYTGTLAAEITLLLRRLLERCGLSSEQVLHIATSATIGRDTPGELESFSAQLFTKQQSLIQVIHGQNIRIPLPCKIPPKIMPSFTRIVERQWLNQPTIELDGQSKPKLVENVDLCDTLSENLALLVDETIVQKARPHVEDKPAILLHAILRYSPLLHRIESIFWERQRLPLRDLAKQLWGTTDNDAIQATVILLQVGASARQHVSDYPLLPHRIHVLARPTDGLVLCLNSNCLGESDLKLDGFGCISEGLHDHCVYCQSATLSLYRCDNCGTWVVAGVYDETHTYLKPVPTVRSIGNVQCMTPNAHIGAEQVTFDRTTGRCDETGTDELTLYLITACPHCEADNADNWRPFAQLASLALSILAESVLAKLPEYPAPYKQWLPAHGRRMLVFSDSRRAAARLGPRLTRQHETQLVRAALVQCLREAPIVDDAVLQDLQEEIVDLERQLALDNFTLALRQKKLRRLADKRQELLESQVGGTMSEWADGLRNIDIVEQLLDLETAPSHEATLWVENTQDEWNKNTQQVYKQLKLLLVREFARPTQWPTSLEALGLAEVAYPGLDTLAIPDKLLGMLPTVSARSQLSKYWTAFLAALCDTLRTDGAITLGSEDEDKAYQFSNLLGHWCAEEKESGNRLLRFVGATSKHRRRKFAAVVLRKCGISEGDLDRYAERLLREAFHQLQAHAGKTITWLETKQRQSDNGGVAWAIRLKFSELCLRRPATLYRCPTTGYIWVREVLGCAPEVGCVNLEQVDEGILDQDPRVMRQRREFISSPVFKIGLWAEEHSAQLAPKENRRLQDLFKAGVRNILSSTTTMELGIDIGGLNAVLMSNVPPGKANYLQRAGRAGRRADGSSIVTTFCHPQPFDRAVFLHFGEYLGRSLRSPKVFLERRRLVCRHGHAFLLGEFFRGIYPHGTHVGAMNAFGRIGVFCGIALPPMWKKGSDKPAIQPYVPDWKPPAQVVWWNPSKHKLAACRRNGRSADERVCHWEKEWNRVKG
jgi:DEAD/DEAH box helicase domain-containing protein